MRIAATFMTPIQVIESFRTKLQSIGISSFMQINFESTNSKVICESKSDACPQRAFESDKRLRLVTGGAPPARRRFWRLADTQRCCSSERLRMGKKGLSGGATAGLWPCERFFPSEIWHTVRSSAQTDRVPYLPSGRISIRVRSYTSPKSKSERPDVTDVKEKASSAYEAFFMGTSESLV